MGAMATIEERMCEVAGHLNAQHAELVDLTTWLLANAIEWSGPGVWRADQFLSWKMGLAPSRARQIVDIAERVGELPACVGAFRRGELSIDQMAAIAKRAPWWTDDEMCGLAKMMTVRQVRNVLARYPFPDIPMPGVHTDVPPESETEAAQGDAAPDGVEPPESAQEDDGTDTAVATDAVAEPADRCSFHFDDDGRFYLHLETDKATGDIIESALTEARDRRFHGVQHDVTWTDALREVCERSLDAAPNATRRNRFRINYHLDVSGSAADARGWRLPDAIRRYVTCDGMISPVFIDGAKPVSVGRTQHIVPDRTRRLVELRDRGCRVPGCNQTRWLDVHHIVHWSDLGPTDTWNLICLCPHHHRLHHRGELGIRGNADDSDGVVFTNARGNPIAQSGARPTPPGAPPSPPVGRYRHPLGERLDGRWLYFNPPPEHRPVVARPRSAGSASQER